MKVVFRVDASEDIGTGHVMRCLALASEFKKRKFDITFITRDIKGHLSKTIKKEGYKNILLQAASKKFTRKKNDLSHAHWISVTWDEDAADTINAIGDESCDWLIVDHYSIDYRWHQELRSKTKKIMVIDDLADRKLDCDLLLDQNFYIEPLSRYKNIIPQKCLALLGPHHMLLREEFLNPSTKKTNLENNTINILVFMGGADLTNETAKVLKALDLIKSHKFHANVIIGGSNPFNSIIRDMCEERDYTRLHQNISNMSELCNESDMAMGTGGVATLERCFMGLPSLVMLTADNQVETTLALHKIGAIQCIGWHYENDSTTILNALLSFINKLNKQNSTSEIYKKIFGKECFCGVNGLVDIMEKVSRSKNSRFLK